MKDKQVDPIIIWCQHSKTKPKRIYGVLMRSFRNILTGFLFLLYVLAGSISWAVVYESLPDMPYPADNPATPEKEKLGSVLFFDTQLSGNNKISCSTCHLRELNWIDQKPQAIGFKAKKLERNSPTILNSGYSNSQFWDGRATSLEEQALMPIQDPSEMNLPLPDLIDKLNSIPEYLSLFKSAFGDSKITPERISKAIATFERTLITQETNYDRYWKGDESAISVSAKRGMNLFFGKAKCSICHTGPRFTDDQFHNIGVATADTDKEDIGRKKVTGEKFHLRAFKTPGLRYVSRTAPYMHDGSLNTLQEVVEFYDLGGNEDSLKSPFISPIGLTPIEKKDLVEFIKALDKTETPY
jgi:cytochrome c peroxidase